MLKPLKRNGNLISKPAKKAKTKILPPKEYRPTIMIQAKRAKERKEEVGDRSQGKHNGRAARKRM